MTVETEKYTIEKPEVKQKKLPREYFATKEECDNPKLRRGVPTKGAYKNISAWRVTDGN